MGQGFKVRKGSRVVYIECGIKYRVGSGIGFGIKHRGKHKWDHIRREGSYTGGIIDREG